MKKLLLSLLLSASTAFSQITVKTNAAGVIIDPSAALFKSANGIAASPFGTGITIQLNNVTLTGTMSGSFVSGGTFGAVNGSALTNLNASNLGSGTVADARLSANVALLDAANSFSGGMNITGGVLNVVVPATFTNTLTATGGITVTGANDSDFTGCTGLFKTSTGLNVFNGVAFLNNATTPSLTTQAGKTNTGFLKVNGKTSGSITITTADATARDITLLLAAQTVGDATLTIGDLGGAAKTVAFTSSNITGSAATLTTPRAIYGNNFDGSAALTQIIASTYGGTGNGFTKFSGPTTAERTKTLRDASDTIMEVGGSYTPGVLTLTNSVGLPLTTGVTGTLPVANGGTGQTVWPKFRVHKNGTNQTMTAGAQAAVTFGTEEFDTNNEFASSTHTVSRTGYVHYDINIYMAALVFDEGAILLLLDNGTEVRRWRIAALYGSSSYPTQSYSDNIAVTSGHTMTIELYMSSAINRDIDGTATRTSWSGFYLQ